MNSKGCLCGKINAQFDKCWQLNKACHRVEFDDEYSYIMLKDKERCLIKSKYAGTMFSLYISLVIVKPQLFFYRN